MIQSLYYISPSDLGKYMLDNQVEYAYATVHDYNQI